jgi:hypothetical protein
MCNQETLAILGTPDTRRRQTKQKSRHKKTNKNSNTTPTKTGCVRTGRTTQNNIFGNFDQKCI